MKANITDLKKQAHSLVLLAKKKGKITKYEDFIKTDLAKETALTKEEIKYYTSKRKEINNDEV